MVKELTENQIKITREAIALYKSLCIEWQRMRKRPPLKGTVFRLILTKDFGSRSQVDLIYRHAAMDKREYKEMLIGLPRSSYQVLCVNKHIKTPN